MVALREPSLCPCFEMKGGVAGGGYAQVVPMEDIITFYRDFTLLHLPTCFFLQWLIIMYIET